MGIGKQETRRKASDRKKAREMGEREKERE